MSIIPWQQTYIKQLFALWNEIFADTFPMREELFSQNSFQYESVLPLVVV